MEKVKTGITGLDEMLSGGIHRGSICLIKGAAGTGKTSIGIEFLVRGIENFSENGLLVTFEHFPKELYRDALSLSFDLKEHENEKKLKILFTSPSVFLSSLEEPDGEFDELVSNYDIKRCFIDSINHLEGLSSDPNILRKKIYSFLNALKRHEITTMIAQEDLSLTGELKTVEYGVSYIVDTLIQLRYVEINSSLEKAILIIKERASAHDKKIRKLDITSNGIKIEKEFEGVEGVLSGSPRKTLFAKTAAEEWKP